VGSAVGRALDEQKPIYIPDLEAELSKIPQLGSQARLGSPHSAYIFPNLDIREETRGVDICDCAEGAIQP